MSKTIGKQVDAVTKAQPGAGVGMKRGFLSIDGVSAELTGLQILRLAGNGGIVTITEDTPVRVTSQLSTDQLWPYSSEVAQLWPTFSNPSSAHDRRRRLRHQSGPKDFVNRPGLRTVPASQQPAGTAGHGTSLRALQQAAPAAQARSNAKLVSIDVIDDSGMGMTSDVIAAVD
jgi:hypothetical protein